MNPALLAVVLAAPTLLAATADSLDPGSLLKVYGVAAPFAAVCFWVVLQARKDRDQLRSERDDARREAADARAETQKVRDDALARERELTGRLGPMVYDSALLFEKGTARVAESPTSPQLERLTEAVDELARKLDER